MALLRQNFLSPIRLREWHDVHTQLSALVGEQGWRVNQTEATFEQLHLALLSGLLGNIGFKSDEGGHYQGAREIRFHIHPGSRLVKKAGRWVVAAELVETTGCTRAAWRASSRPGWNGWPNTCCARTGRTRAGKEGRAGGRQRARHAVRPDHLYRPAHPLRPGQPHARELFIRQALVPGEIDTRLAFVAHNRKLIAGIEKLEHQTRRPDILVDDELIYAFYDRQLPADISQTATLEKWVSGLDKAAAASSC